MELHNLMEYEVGKYLDEIIKKGIHLECNCEQCKLDITAIALNSLPPKYVVTERGLIFSRINNMNHQFSTDIVAALTKAIELVNKKPRHK